MYQGHHGNKGMLVNCSNCWTPHQILLGVQWIICARCQAITWIAYPQEVTLPPPAAAHNYPQQQPYPPSPYNIHAPVPPYHLSSPYNHAPPGPPPSVHGQKKAVICGISYRNSLKPLEGCMNDAKCMRHLLIDRFKFPKGSIVMLTEDETDPHSWLPTKQNMRKALNWLVQGCQPGDSLLFYYAGHGSQIKGKNVGDEVDGFDETLCPLDFETEGKIVDDEINRTIVNPLPPGVKLHAIIDACNSGTALDLPFLCRVADNENGGTQHRWDDHRPRSSSVWKGTNGGEAILFSGCDDDQYSHENPPTNTTAGLLDGTITGGVMTISFIDAIEKLGVGATYGSILRYTRNAIIPLIANANADAVKSFLKEGSLGERVYNTLIGREGYSLGDAIKSVVNMLPSSAGSSVGRRGDLDQQYSTQDEKYIQEPQLTSNHPFDIHATQFFL